MKRFRALLAAVLLVVSVAWAASFTPITRNSGWPPQAGTAYKFGGPYEIYWQAVPTSLKDMDSCACDNHIISYAFYNPTGGAITLTVQTKDASPLALPGSGSLAAGQSVLFNIPGGLLVKGGWSVQASGPGVLFSGVWTH